MKRLFLPLLIICCAALPVAAQDAVEARKFAELEIRSRYPEARVLYARRDAVPMHASADPASAVVDSLPLGVPVAAFSRSGDFTAVASPADGRLTYVRSRDLTRRAPAVPTQGAAAPAADGRAGRGGRRAAPGATAL